jgi:hypothetical protein
MRTGPNELHCNDPSFIDEVYASSGRKRDKQAHCLAMLIHSILRDGSGHRDDLCE